MTKVIWLIFKTYLDYFSFLKLINFNDYIFIFIKISKTVLSLCINSNLILYAQPNRTLKNRRGKVGELITLNSCNSLPISINQLIS